MEDQRDRHRSKQLPITHNKDVEFSREAADEDDFEALQRAESAEQRNKVDQ